MSKFMQLQFLRNGKLYSSRGEAIQGLKKTMSNYGQDGTMLLARYKDKTNVKTVLGVVYSDDERKFMTIFKSDSVITEDIEPRHNLYYENLYEKQTTAVS